MSAAALSAFFSACGLLTEAALLDELELLRGGNVVGLILVSLLVCLVCALGALLALVCLAQSWSEFDAAI